MAVERLKKKKVSKKLKSSWRKHVDVKDVEDFLEDKRLEERISKVPLDQVPDKELFVLDTKPTLELLSQKDRKKLLLTKPLKCFSALQPHSKVPDPIVKRNRVRTQDERRNELFKLKDKKRREKRILKAKERLAIKNRELHNLRKNNNPKRGEFNTDLWDSNNDIKALIEKDEWASAETKLNNLRGIGIIKKKKISKVNRFIPPIEPPHPGTSYNPSYEDHQDLLRTIAEKEKQLIKTEKHLARVTTGMFQKVSRSTKDQMWLVEMSEGLPSTTELSVEENEDGGNEYQAINPPVVNKKKTLKQRKKQKEQLELEKARWASKQEKKKITDIHKIKVLNEQVEKIEKRQKVLNAKRKKNLESKKLKTKMLNSKKFEEPDVEFKMCKEITGDLKNLKAEGNLLMDRFKSMQKRNILAPTIKQKKPKVKVKKYVKPGHKEEDWKKTVAGHCL